MEYYCDKSFNQSDDNKWIQLINLVFEKCDTVEFNILNNDYKKLPEIKNLSKFLIRKDKRKNKIFSSGYFLEYSLSSEVKMFIKSKKYCEWMNYCLEDISLKHEGKEILATITHENYVIMLLSNKMKDSLNKDGFDFILIEN